jgi:TetR/AcrR family transcriptional regulator, regulator of autoinduction and epiphytic fitness
LDRSISRLEEFVHEALSVDIRRLDSEQRHARILAAAIQECSERSFRSASVAEIAKRARVSTASLYRDFGTREKMLEAAISFALPLVLAELTAQVEETDPRARLIALLIRHCAIFDHPHASWLYRAHVSGELAQGSGIHEYALAGRTGIEAFWYDELAKLEDVGILSIPDKRRAVNFLLGAVQRRTLLAMLLFGSDDVAGPQLETAAASAVDWLWTQYARTASHEAAPQ